MKKRTLIPAVIAMGFFAGCDFSSWCECTKKTKEPVAKEAAVETHAAAPEEMHPAASAQATPPAHPEAPATPEAPEATPPSAIPAPAPMPEEPEELAMPEEEPAAMPAPKAPAPKAATPEEEENPMQAALENAAAKK